MTDEPPSGLPDQAAIYTIRAQGLIAQEGQEQFAGFIIEVGAEAGWAVTTLTGSVRDPAALQDVLTQLYNRGLIVINVERQDRRSA